MVPSIPDMALRKKLRAEALSKPLGLSSLTNAAKGNPNRKTGNKN